MTRRKHVRIPVDQLVDLIAREPPAFFIDWRCRLCGRRDGAVDSTAGLDQAAAHLQESHHAHGGLAARRRKST